MASSAVSKLTVPPELALEFMATFSRFEYALKVTRFRQNGAGEAKANWTLFASEVSALFKPNRSEILLEAFNYITSEPLKILAVQDGILDWYELAVPTTCEPAAKAIRIIKQVRHNLFHGGKFALDLNASEDRDIKLLTYSLQIMSDLKQLIPEVYTAYEY